MFMYFFAFSGTLIMNNVAVHNWFLLFVQVTGDFSIISLEIQLVWHERDTWRQWLTCPSVEYMHK